MRVLVFLLILANLLFLAWEQGYFGSPARPDAKRLEQQLLADQIRIVSNGEPPPVAAKNGKNDKAAKDARETEPKPAARACLVLSGLTVAEADQIESLLAAKLPDFRRERTGSSAKPSYWVHIPASATKKEADSKAAELKALGIQDFFIMKEDGPNALAISLGVFARKEAAASYLEKLRAKGVKSARVIDRNEKQSAITLEIRGEGAQSGALEQILAEALPSKKATACRNANAAP